MRTSGVRGGRSTEYVLVDLALLVILRQTCDRDRIGSIRNSQSLLDKDEALSHIPLSVDTISPYTLAVLLQSRARNHSEMRTDLARPDAPSKPCVPHRDEAHTVEISHRLQRRKTSSM